MDRWAEYEKELLQKEGILKKNYDNNLTDQAKELIEKRYSQKDDSGKPIETWTDIVKRVVDRVIGDGEKIYGKSDEEIQKLKEEYYDILGNLEFLPNSPTLVNIGVKNEKGRAAFACYVVDIQDTLDDILKQIENIGKITKAGGGIGVNLSNIRPEGDKIQSTHGKALGPIKVLETICSLVGNLSQSGFRAGALLAGMDISHPDIERFIDLKLDRDYVKAKNLDIVNISVKVTNDFMEAVKHDKDWGLKFNGKVYKIVKARDLWNRICENARKVADPGIIFWDNMLKYTPYTPDHVIVNTNPCVSGDTLVTVYDKEQEEFKKIPIKHIQEGDYVLSYNIYTKKLEAKKVLWAGMTRKNAKVVKTYYDNKELIRTPDHLIYDPNTNTYSETPNEALSCFAYKNFGRNELHIENKKFLYQIDYGYEDVYDIVVEDNHNFFANDILVHNCGEFVGSHLGICCLGSIDVSKCFDCNDFDWEKFGYLIRKGVRFLDNILDISNFPTEEIKEKNLEERNIGLGIMGYADLLIKMKFRYGSQKALEFTEKLCKFLKTIAFNESEKLGEEKGIPENLLKHGINRRNLRLLVQAPTGSLSRIANCSFGIEPVFSWIFESKLSEFNFLDINKNIQEYMDKHNLTLEQMKEKIKNKELPDYYVKADELNYKEHIDTQAIFQKYYCNAISKTINLPKETTTEEVSKIYMYAYEKGLKGITIYVDGSLDTQVIIDKTKEIQQLKDIVKSYRHKVNVNGSKVYINVSVDEDGKPLEIFAKLPKKIGEVNGEFDLLTFTHHQSHWEIICRAISKLLRLGVSIEEILDDLYKSSYNMFSLPAILSRVLAKYLDKKTIEKSPKTKCPSCGKDTLIMVSGCNYCMNCNYSKCG